MRMTVKLLGITITVAALVMACGKDQKAGAEKGAKSPATAGAGAKTGDAGKIQAEDSLNSARATLAQAKDTGANVESAEVSLRDATDAFTKGAFDKASMLATQAQQQAAQAHNQMQLDKAKALILVAQKSRKGLSGDDQILLRDAETAYDAGQGETALHHITALMNKNTVATTSGKVERYVVVVGDSLWIISAKPEVYNDPYQWPLIYKANTDRIKDPDRVLPGWQLTIKHDYTQTEIREAIAHARHRGTWKLGKNEEADMKYLGLMVEDHKLAGNPQKGKVADATGNPTPIGTSPRVTNTEIEPSRNVPASQGTHELPPPIEAPHEIH
ncbi:MAG: LysM peptidoglycan-binding domain-containing protein [Gammaproteobacteria bacterium]|nr:LysM peptidoglycan-binding domain-containing protein [Gammaproteobacteria bacterium]